MLPEDTQSQGFNSLPADELDYRFTESEIAQAPAIAGFEVTEYDELTGQKEWNDSLFVQDFTDSVLATNPAPLDFEVE